MMTELQRKICELYPDHIGREIADMLGCSKDTVCKTAARYGVKHSEETNKRIHKVFSNNITQWARAQYQGLSEKHRRVLELYPDHTTKEIADMLGYRPTTVNVIARRHGVKHNKDVLERASDNRRRNLLLAITPEANKKKSDSMKKLYRMEARRVELGLKKKSKYRVKSIPDRVYKAKHNLVHKYGYIYTDDPYTLFYDEHTNRCISDNRTGRAGLFTEDKYYTQKYGIKFIADYQ